MKRVKRIMPLCLAAALAAVTPAAALAGTPEFARTSEEWERLRDNTMEYDEIGDLIHEYNSAVKNNQLDINNKRNGKEITSEEMAQAYRDSAQSIRASMDGTGTDYSLELQARQMEQKADSNVSDLEVYKLTYSQAEASLTMAAENNLITYQQKLMELPAAEKNRELLGSVHQSAVAKVNAGTATQIDVLNAQKDIQDADAAIAQSKADIEKLRQTMCVMLGWSYDAAPEIKDVPAADLSRIDSMNPQNDKVKALENNYELKINKRKLENSQSDNSKQTLTISIKDNEEKIGADLSAKYQAVLQAKASYDQSAAEFDLAGRKLQAANLKFSVGQISALDRIQEENNYAAKQSAAKVADLNLLKAMEAYDWAVSGLASTQ